MRGSTMVREEGRSWELEWGPLVNLETILRFQNSQTLLNLPCLFFHPCVMKLVMPCLETTYFAVRFVLLKLFFHCSSFLQSPFFSLATQGKNSSCLLLIGVLTHFELMGYSSLLVRSHFSSLHNHLPSL